MEEAEGKVGSGWSSTVETEKTDRRAAINGEISVTMKASEQKAAGSISWVVKMEKMLGDTDPSTETLRWEKTCVYRVPEWIKELTNAKAFRPWLVSMGPFHHGEPDLLPMEEHKRRAVLHLVNRSGRPVGEFVAAVEEVGDRLQDAYQGLDDRWRGEGRGRFVEMMVMDGCFLLEIMRAAALKKEDEGGYDYAHNDPVFSKHGLHNLFSAIRADLVLVENQLPLLALERLVVAAHNGTPPSALEINNNVRQFLGVPSFPRMENELGLHPLDIFHSSFCGGRPRHEESGEAELIIPTATELSEAGVHFRESDTPWVHDVGFENGVLSIPARLVDEGTEKELLNLRVFEQLHGSAGSDVTNYLFFMDHIIDSERDAGLLRSNGIVKKWISSDKALADLFNNLTTGATSKQSKKLNDVLREVKAHCAKRRNQWRAFFVRTYLSNPWVFISLVVAIILLVATLMQTVYTVVPFYTTNS